MKHTFFLIFLTLLAPLAAAETKSCISMSQIVESSLKNHQVVAPVEREYIIKLVQLRVLKPETLLIAESFYVQIGKSNKVNLFNMKNGCADNAWIFPKDFLILLGFIIA